MKFFSLENPIWKFIGNLADFFLLSCLWYLCCLPVVTAGAATTALYYVTLKMARGQEGQLIPAFFHSFKQNLKQATALWVGYLAVGILLVLDLVICLQTSSVFAGAMFFTSVVLLACWALFITMLFPLVARCDNTIGALFKMGIAIYPLDDYIASGVVDVSGIGDANLKTTQDTEGHQLGISNGLNSYGIAYDPDMFAEAGVAEPTDTWTWDDYANAANTIHEKLGIYGCSSMLTSEFIAGCSVYVAQYGDVGQYSFFNLDLTGMGFDDPQMLTPYIQMRADSIKNEVYPDAGASAEITNIENDFLVTGEAAMAWVAANQFPTMYNVCQDQGRTLKLATLPRITSDGPSGAVIQSSQMLCVSQDSQQKEEAAKFISWFENDPDCNNILQGERGIPVNATVRETLSANATEGQQIMYDFMDKVSKFKMPDKVNVLSPDGQDEVVDNYRNYIQQVVDGQITAEEAAQKTYDDAAALFTK
ncbi:MAG TPA: ABC transporter substrate-binding protein [Ruminococcaceae bacterium]|nr:ABC transporter substrate-binding protein [Oscillospiraceae bacterium]